LKAKSLASQGGIAEELRCGSEFKTWVRSLCTNSWSIPLIKFYDCDNSNKRISLAENLNHLHPLERALMYTEAALTDSVIACTMKGFSPFISFAVRNRMHPVSHSCPGCSICSFFPVMCSKEAIYVETTFPVYITQHRILMILFQTVQESHQRSVPVLPEVL
jgi:hypothetical protein